MSEKISGSQKFPVRRSFSGSEDNEYTRNMVLNINEVNFNLMLFQPPSHISE
jgi:hypothetical protein